MVFKLLIVILALLVLDGSGERSAARFPLERWELYKYNLIKDLYKRGQHSDSEIPNISVRRPLVSEGRDGCLTGKEPYNCTSGTPQTPAKSIPADEKRAKANLDLMGLIRLLSREEEFEPEQYVPYELEYRLEK